MPSLRCFVFALVALAGPAAFAADEIPAPELVDLINRYRAEAPQCADRDATSLAPLRRDVALEQVRMDAGGALPPALERAGYLSARAQAIVIGGAPEIAAAMALLGERYCGSLLDPGFTRIAAMRGQRGRWRVLLAQPLLSPGLASAGEEGRTVLAQVNAARAQARVCGIRRYPAAPALRWSAPLAQAALGHSEDMARHDYFDHRAPDGSNVAQRVARSGYSGRRIGENIAAGQGDAAQAVAGWVASPGHCANLMDAAYTEMGAAYAIDAGSRSKIYWTQVFGTPR